MGNNISRRDEILEKYKDIVGENAKDWYHHQFINFLEGEIKKEVWKSKSKNNNKYDKFFVMNEKPLKLEEARFCKWEEIQKEIFDAVLSKENAIQFLWSDYAEGLIEKTRNSHGFSNKTCNEIYEEEVRSEAVDHFENIDSCKSHLVNNICLPERRKRLYVDGIESNINSISHIIDNISSPQLKAQYVGGSLASSISVNIENEIKKLRNEGKSEEHICTIMQRSIAHYKDIFLINDIVPYPKSTNIQCFLFKIRDILKKGENTDEYDKLWDRYFKQNIELSLKTLTDENGKPCEVYNRSNTDFQCLRFLEEWFEEFLKQKLYIQNNIIHRCVNKKSKKVTLVDGRNLENTCEAYCKGYELFLQNGRSCYNIYLKKCKENIAKSINNNGKNNGEYIATTEINSMLKKIKKKLNCPDYICGEDYNVNLSPYFLPSDANFSLHKGYHCGCQPYNNNLKNILKKYSEQNGHSTTISELENILNELSLCTMHDDDLDGSVGGKGEKLVTKSGTVKNICGVNYYDSFIRKNTGNPCGSNKIEGKGWICDGTRGGETLKTEWKNKACMPPRTRVLCLGFLCNEENKYHLDATRVIDSSQKLLTELVYAAIVEGQNLKKNYKGSTDTEIKKLCNALKYSFADLGDIVRGRSIWENGYIQRMETNLKAIFDKIYNKLPSEKKSLYNDTRATRDTSYHYLREAWWNTNREYIWRALLCGAGVNVDGCGATVPNIDYMPQFLRWLTEWSQDFCQEKNTYDIRYLNPKNQGEDKNIESMCSGCDSNTGNVCLNSYPNVGHASSNTTCSKCRTTCKQYKTWMENKKKEYDRQKNKYDDEIKKSKNGPNLRSAIRKSHISDNSKNVTEIFFNKIEKDYPDVNEFLDDRLQHTGCKDNIDPIEFAKVNDVYNSPFNEKHKHCRNCAEQKILQDITGGNMLTDGVAGTPQGYTPSSSAPPTSGGTDAGGTPRGSKNVPQTPTTTTSTTTPNVSTVQNECDLVLEKMSNYWDCNEKDKEKKYSVCKLQNGTISVIDDDDDKDEDGIYNDEFFKLFNKWLNLFLEEYKIFKHKMKECKTNSPLNKKVKECHNKDCKLKCYCFNKWIKKRKKEWIMQKQYYEEFNKKNYGDIDLSFLYKLDLYFQSKFQQKFLTALGHEISIHELQQNEGENDPLKPILIKLQELIDDCMRNCPKKLECHEKGFKNEWECETAETTAGGSGTGNSGDICLKRDHKNKYGQANMDKVENVYQFYDSFEEWIDYMEKSINEKMKILKKSCENQLGGRSSRGSGSILDCEMCNDDCDCYKNWKEKVETQWGKLKGYYENYKKRSDNHMQDIELDVFLEALCETKYGGNSGGTSQDDICTKLKGDKQNFVDGLIHNSDENKTKVCDVCKEANKPVEKHTCSGIADLQTTECREKEFDGFKGDGNENKAWICSGTKVDKNACVPPRGQSICVANMVNANGTTIYLKGDQSDLEKQLKRAIKTETKRLWEKNKSDENKACRLTHRSFNDYKYMVLGNSLWKYKTIKGLEDKIGEIIQKRGTIATTEERQKWWKDHEHEFWNALKCGIKAGNGDPTGCPRFINDDDQFEWWAKEWSDDFYDKRKTLAEQVEAKCGSGSNGCNVSQTKPNGTCLSECENYQNFLTLKRNEWTNNFKKYLQDKEKEHENKNHKYSVDDEKIYMPQNHYLISTCAHNSCTGKEFIGILSDKKLYGQYEKECTCNTSPPTEQKNPCDINFEFHACNDKKYDLGLWSSTYVKNPKDRGKVFAPPRRNSICIGWLFSPFNENNKDEAKKKLKERVIDAAKGEAHYLWKKYNGSSSGGGNTTEYCSALKRSFADIGDMVKGTDLWSGGYSELVENNIRSVFAMRDGTATFSEEDILAARKSWWDQHKSEVWTAMNCNNKNTCNGGSTPDDDEKPQFLRWLEEWSEHICEERQKQLKELQKNCNGSGKDVEKDKNCDKGSEDCKKQCYRYNRWITTHKNEWLGQKSKYEVILNDKFGENYDDFKQHMKGNADANTYITSKNDKCKSGSANDINMDTIFNKTDDDYKKYEPFCTTCRINDIAEKAKESKRVNPCGEPKGKPTTLVKKVAQEMKTQAEKDATTRSGDISKLKGDASKGTYKHNGQGSDLQNDICGITDKHSNDRRTSGDYQGPCQGKGTSNKADINTRFVVGVQWKTDPNHMHTNHPDVIMPPRRRHICTSNLEHLKTDSEGLKGNNVNDSFLGDVLLTSKYEAEKIIEQYKQKNGLKDLNEQKDKDSVCRAMKYSFADLGDIIRGRDIWTEESGNKDIQKYLKEIFKKIKEQNGNGKYNSDTETTTPPYKTLREHWWTANRDKVWDAMKCGYKGSVTCNGEGNTPFDDYIPQRLRWMTEWAEWFCKAQNKYYGELKEACNECKLTIKSDKTCTKCKECKMKCEAYSKFVKEWETDWGKQKEQYKNFMTETSTYSGSNGGKDEIKKTLLEFLKKLQTLNGTNTTFENAEGYVHDIGNFDDCQEQNVFCNDGNDHYAFKYPPHEYKDQCTCTPPAAAAKPVATKPEVTRPQAAKPAETKPATTKPVVPSGAHANGGQGAGRAGPTSQAPVVRGAEVTNHPDGSTTYTITTKNEEGTGTLSVTTTPSSTPTPPDTSSSGPGPTTSATSAPTTSTTSGSGGGDGPHSPTSPPSPAPGTSSPTNSGSSSSSSGSSASGTPPPGQLSNSPGTQKATIPVLQPRSSYNPNPIRRIMVDSSGKKIVYPSNQSGSSSINIVKKSTYPMNCVEKVADKLRMDSQKNKESVKSKLEGKDPQVVYDKNGTGNSVAQQTSCKINKSINEFNSFKKSPCEDKGNPFDEEKEKWECNKGRNRGFHEHICVPPRRRHMCTRNLETFLSRDVKDTNDLLKEVLLTAAYEGEHIKKEWEKHKNNQSKSELCDAMKYSFADLADIVRGTDLWKNGQNYIRLEKRLKTVFRQIYSTLNTKEREKYDDTSYYKIRSAWWAIHRDKVWKALTCEAPENAFLVKTVNNYDNNSLPFYLSKCGHEYDPPVDDYIPQRFRWMQEWSEHFCRKQKDEIEKLKEECQKCELNGSTCQDDNDGKKCENCKKTCKAYSEFINKWKSQFDIQSKTYNELYKKTNDSRGGSPSSDDHVTNFLKEVKSKCENPSSAEKYLDKTSNCSKTKFTQSDGVNGSANDNRTYAFKTPPVDYEKACECQIPDPLDKCPDEKNGKYENVCKTLYNKPACTRIYINNDLDEWNENLVRNSYDNNKGVLAPPRRRQLCTKPLTQNTYKSGQKEEFKKDLLDSAYTHGVLLRKIYPNSNNEALQTMKYSFADYGDIIKGTDMMETTTKQIKDILENLLKNAQSHAQLNKAASQPNDVNEWWNKNKKHVWHAMLCGYKSQKKTEQLDQSWCNVPSEEEKTDQFLRWMTEWAQQFCKEKKNRAQTIKNTCQTTFKELQKYSSIKDITDNACRKMLNEYKQWFYNKNPQWKGLTEKYKKHRQNNHNSGPTLDEKPEKYLTSKCNECNCNINYLENISKETYDNKELLKELFDIIQLETDPSVKTYRDLSNKTGIDAISLKKAREFLTDVFQKGLTYSILGTKIGIGAAKQATQYGIGVAKQATQYGIGVAKQATQYGIEAAQKAGGNVLSGINSIISSFTSRSGKPGASKGPGTVTPYQPSLHPKYNNTNLTNNMLSSTIPVGISFALGSIVLLFYMKKKPILRPTKLFRIIDIPQNDYGIPDKASTNRYIPYGQYKGKTYIYVEGEETDDYIRDISSSDITSSSESEVEEMDINDIYPYKSPKYKTLIEVVLKPSNKTTYDDTYKDNIVDTSYIPSVKYSDKHSDIPSDIRSGNTKSVTTSDIPTNKPTDEEWNQLKQDFISQYLKHIGPDVPLNNELQTDDMPKDIQTNIIHDNMEEKPFITSIQDRDLNHGAEEVTYNINWNIPKQNQIADNTTDNVYIKKYESQNNIYSGVDLINDSLKNYQHVDIYDEILKRKENEMFGTKHPKTNTSFYRVASINDKNPLEN